MPFFHGQSGVEPYGWWFTEAEADEPGGEVVGEERERGVVAAEHDAGQQGGVGDDLPLLHVVDDLAGGRVEGRRGDALQRRRSGRRRRRRNLAPSPSSDERLSDHGAPLSCASGPGGSF